MLFKPGDKVFYVPMHALENGRPNWNHKDIENGKIIRYNEDKSLVFVEFTNKSGWTYKAGCRPEDLYIQE